jgi:hypothetical protein
MSSSFTSAQATCAALQFLASAQHGRRQSCIDDGGDDGVGMRQVLAVQQGKLKLPAELVQIAAMLGSREAPRADDE